MKWWHWLPQVRLRDLPRLARILARTQRLMDPEHYLARTTILERPRPADGLEADTRDG